MTNWVQLDRLDNYTVDEPRAVAGPDGTPLCVVRLIDDVRVFADRCPHAECELSDGTVADGDIECPCHGALFSLLDGEALAGPTKDPIVFLDHQLQDGMVVVDLRP